MILTDFLKILDWSSVMRASAGLELQGLAWHYILLSKFFHFRDTAVTLWWKKQDVSHPVSWQSVLIRWTRGGSLFNAHLFPFPHFYICQQTKIGSHQLVLRSAPWLSVKFFPFESLKAETLSCISMTYNYYWFLISLEFLGPCCSVLSDFNVWLWFAVLISFIYFILASKPSKL